MHKWLLYITILFLQCISAYSQEMHLLKVKGGYRYLNANGEWAGPLIPTNHRIREHLENGWFITQAEDYSYKFGLIDQQGRIILPAEYDDEIDIETGYLKGLNFIICGKVEDHYKSMGLVDTNGNQLLPFVYWGLEYHKAYWTYGKYGGESGVMDANFKVIIKGYRTDFKLYDHLIIEDGWDSLWTYNYSGQKISADPFQKIIPYFGGRCFVFKRNDRFGLLNYRGEIIRDADLIMEPVFEPEGTALTEEAGKGGWNIIDTTGKLLIQPYQNGWFSCPNGYINFSNSNLAVKSGPNWGIADRLGNLLVPFWFREFTLDSNAFQHDLYIFPTDSGYGMINSEAKIVLKPLFDSIWVDVGGRIFIRDNNRYGMADKTGKIILPIENEKIYSFKDGYAEFQKNQKWGLLNSNGEVFIAPEYDWVSYYCKYAAAVGMDGKCMLVDSTGKMLTPLSDWIYFNQYDCRNGYIVYSLGITDFHDDYEQGIPHLIDSSGNVISVEPFHFVMDIGDYFLVNKTGDYGDGYSPEYEGGLLDKQGKLILAPQKKTWITRVFRNDSFIVTTPGGHFYYTPNGEKKKLD